MGDQGQEALAILKAIGISTAGRKRKLRKRLTELEGIRKIEFNYILDTVSITYDSDKVTLAKIRNAIHAPR
jgi:copper chaperone CopZ